MRQASTRQVFGSRRLFVALVFLGLFVLFDLGLLGWFIFRSLSQREVERVLLQTRTEAEGLAERIEGTASKQGKDLYTAVAVEREIQTYFDSILSEREIVQTVEIFDKDGILVFRSDTEAEAAVGDQGTVAETGEFPRQIDMKTFEWREEFDLEVPIGEFGIIHIGISQVELQKRISNLRQELVRQTGLIGAVTLVVLALAYLVIWWQWKRSRRLEEQAGEAERLAYIGTLASGLAHEIRNPLNSLSLNLQLLEEEAGQELRVGASRRLFTITRDEIGRLERLVTDFLRYAKPRPLELRSVRAADLLERSVEVLAREIAARGALIEVRDLTAGACVSVDTEQMSQLLLNLVQNALAATESTGRRPAVTLSVSRRDERVAIEVEDNGVGIPPGSMSKVFDLFYSTRKGGTGLGLAVVQRVARSHSAEVEIGSTPGAGTWVRVVLPEAEKTSAKQTAPSAAGAHPDLAAQPPSRA